MTLGLGIGDTNVLDLGGIVGAIIGAVILPIMVGFIYDVAYPVNGSEPAVASRGPSIAAHGIDQEARVHEEREKR